MKAAVNWETKGLMRNPCSLTSYVTLGGKVERKKIEEMNQFRL
jgi:hypothetical protein